MAAKVSVTTKSEHSGWPVSLTVTRQAGYEKSLQTMSEQSLDFECLVIWERAGING